uniref:Uncharacterized protein n=1 Tax=Citrifermentans bremense TaxID=60035 RepID=A0A6S6LYW0_9BACT
MEEARLWNILLRLVEYSPSQTCDPPAPAAVSPQNQSLTSADILGTTIDKASAVVVDREVLRGYGLAPWHLPPSRKATVGRLHLRAEALRWADPPLRHLLAPTYPSLSLSQRERGGVREAFNIRYTETR